MTELDKRWPQFLRRSAYTLSGSQSLFDTHHFLQEQLAGNLGMNYQVMNRNIAANKLTIDFVMKLSAHYPSVDMNWLIKDSTAMINEPGETYGRKKKPEELLAAIEENIALLKESLTQK